MWDIETIKFMNSPRGSARIRQLARATNRVKQDANCPKHNTGRKLVKRKAAQTPMSSVFEGHPLS